jgi:hypothetical protein
MSHWLRWLVATAALLVVAWGGYWAVATHALGRALTECGNEVLQEATSADGQCTATAFERGCGATSPFARIVSVRSGATRFDRENRDEWVFTIQGQPDIRLTWTGPEHLTVKYGGGSGRVVRQAVIWNGVAISYE